MKQCVLLFEALRRPLVSSVVTVIGLLSDCTSMALSNYRAFIFLLAAVVMTIIRISKIRK